MSAEPQRVDEPVGVFGVVVEGSVELEGLVHPQLGLKDALLQLDAHAGLQPLPVLLRMRPSTLMLPASGTRSPAMHSTVVVLPAPFGPEDAEHLALLDGERDVVHGHSRAVRFAQMLDLYDGHLAPPFRSQAPYHPTRPFWALVVNWPLTNRPGHARPKGEA